MRQACEIAAQEESRKWAEVWAGRENLSLIGNQTEFGEESVQSLLSKA